MKVVFICASCKLHLSLPLEPLADPRLERLADSEPRLPRGTYSVENWDGPEKGWHVLNLEDVIHTRHGGFLSGCCGIAGLDGKTTVCENGHEVGTEHSDCWQPHALSLDPRSVELERHD